MVVTANVAVRSKNHLDIIDITSEIAREIAGSGIRSGIVTVFCAGSTGAITTIEYEDGLKTDLREALEQLFPYAKDYRHHQTWGDDNGSGHLQSALLKTSFTVPIVDGRMTLGTWQQIIFVECDTRGRHRELVIQIIGE